MAKVALLLTNGYADWECALLNGIGHAYYGIETQKVAPSEEPIISLGGVKTIPDSDLDKVDVSNFDALVICGGSIWECSDAPNVQHIIVDFLEAGKHVAAICGGTLALANSGVLNSRLHTSNASEFLRNNSPDYSGESNYVDRPIAVVDKKIITAAGTSPVSFTAAIFRAVGISEDTVNDFVKMLSLEHI